MSSSVGLQNSGGWGGWLAGWLAGWACLQVPVVRLLTGPLVTWSSSQSARAACCMELEELGWSKVGFTRFVFFFFFRTEPEKGVPQERMVFWLALAGLCQACGCIKDKVM